MTSEGSIKHHEEYQPRTLMMKKEPSMMKVSQPAALLQHLLGPEADHLARETGFIQRERA
jgi:hypothetical protein